MPHDSFGFLHGGGKMGAEVRDFDWRRTPLGDLERWPAALRISVGTMLNSALPQCLAWGPELTTIYNDAFMPLLGSRREALGQPLNAIWKDAWGTLGPICELALQGQATSLEDHPLRINRYGYPENGFFTFSYSPVRDEAAKIRGVTGLVLETTAKVQARQQAELRNSELLHRIKNTYSVISVIANQSYAGAGSLDAAHESLRRRLASLGEAQKLLCFDRVDVADIRMVVQSGLAPFRQGLGRFEITGPEVELSGRQVLALALALNELATNATKYGALSVPSGKVSLRWWLKPAAPAPELHLQWQEMGGPTVVPPQREGFGSFLIRQSLAAEFGGHVTLRYPPQGVECELVAERLAPASALPEYAARSDR